VTSRILGWFAAATVLTLSAGACTQVVAGKGQAAPTGTDASSPTATPSPAPLSPRLKLLRGKLREAHRLAGVVQRPDAVYPTFSGSCIPSGSFYDVDSLSAFGGVFPDNATPIMTAGGYVTGYVQCRQQGASRSLIVAAFEMKDAPACNSTVSKLAQSLKAKGGRLSGYAGRANSYTVELLNQPDYNDRTKKTNTVQRLVCQASVLNYVWSRSPDIATARSTDARMMLGQLSGIRGFAVTPANQLPDLDDDPEQLRPKHTTLPGDLTSENGGYNLASYLALAEDVGFERNLLTKDGLSEYLFFGSTNKEAGDKYVYRGIGLYKLRDEAGAKDVVSQFTDLDKRIHQGIRILNVDGVPGAFCFGFGDKYGQIIQRCFFNKGPITVQVDVGNATRQYDDVTELTKLLKAQYGAL
jgi:hypothetical protein